MEGLSSTGLPRLVSDINTPTLVVTRPNGQVDPVLFYVLHGEHSEGARPPALGHGAGAAPRRDHSSGTVLAASGYQATHQRHFHRKVMKCCNSEAKFPFNLEQAIIVSTEQRLKLH